MNSEKLASRERAKRTTLKLQQPMEQNYQDKPKSSGEETGVKITTVEGTLFKLVETEKEVYITIGKEVLKIFKTKEQCIKYIKSKPWELIMNAAVIYTNYVNSIKEEELQTINNKEK